MRHSIIFYALGVGDPARIKMILPIFAGKSPMSLHIILDDSPNIYDAIPGLLICPLNSHAVYQEFCRLHGKNAVVSECEKAFSPPWTVICRHLDDIDWINFSKHSKDTEIYRRFADYIYWSKASDFLALTSDNIYFFAPYIYSHIDDCEPVPASFRKLPRKLQIDIATSGILPMNYQVLGTIHMKDIKYCPELITKCASDLSDKVLESLDTSTIIKILYAVRGNQYHAVYKNRAITDHLLKITGYRLPYGYLSTIYPPDIVAKFMKKAKVEYNEGNIISAISSFPQFVNVIKYLENKEEILEDFLNSFCWEVMSAHYEFSYQEIKDYYGSIDGNIIKTNPHEKARDLYEMVTIAKREENQEEFIRMSRDITGEFARPDDVIYELPE